MGRCIRDNEAEAVIPGTRIVLDGPGHREGATDREGTAVIEALPIGTYQLAVTLPGFVDVRVSIDVGPSSTASHQFRLRPGMLRTTDYLKPVRETVRTLLLHGPQVDPLGSGEFAHSWRSRPTADLFAALAKLRR